MASKSKEPPCGISELSRVDGVVKVRAWCAHEDAGMFKAIVSLGKDEQEVPVDQARPDLAKKYKLPQHRDYGAVAFFLESNSPEETQTGKIEFKLKNETVATVNFTRPVVDLSSAPIDEPKKNVDNPKDTRKSTKPKREPRRLNLLGGGAERFSAPFMKKFFPTYAASLELLQRENTDLEFLVGSLAEENLRLTEELDRLKSVPKAVQNVWNPEFEPGKKPVHKG